MKDEVSRFRMKASFHPESRLQIWWNLAQLGFLIFPLFPALGAIPIALAILGTGKEKFRQIISRPLNWAIGILSILLILTASIALHRSDAFLGLANFLPFFLLQISFSELIQKPAQLRRIAWILILPSLPIVILGLGQLFFNWYTSGLLANILGWTLIPNGNPPSRMSSVFMYANIFAAYLLIIFILALSLLIENLVISHKKLDDNNHNNSNSYLSYAEESKSEKLRKIPYFQCLFLISVLAFCASAIALTNSRNAWAISSLACLAFAIYLGWRWLLAGIAGIVTIILAAAYAPSPISQFLRKFVPAFFWARLTDRNFPDRPLPYLRTTQWKFTFWMTQQRPLTGWGLRNFTPLYQAKYSTPELPVWLGHPHSLFLMLTGEVGIPTAILFFTLVGWIIYQGCLLLVNINGKKEDKLIIFGFIMVFLACTLFNTVDVSIFDLRINTLGWLLLASICGVVYHRKKYS